MKRKNQGFNLIELMIAITLAATTTAAVMASFSKVYSSFMYNNKFLKVNQELQISMQVIKHDLNNAGIFGGYSFHNESASVSFASPSGSGCSSKWCDFDPTTVGVKSSSGDMDNTGKISPASGSDVLRIQYGGYKIAYLSAVDDSNCITGSKCLINKCTSDGKFYLGKSQFVDSGIDRDGRVLMLTSANHAYELKYRSDVGFGTNENSFELNFAPTNGCPNQLEPYVQIESAVTGGTDLQYDSFDPDIHSMTLSNLNTAYYYISTYKNVLGLYVVKIDNSGQPKDPVLVSNLINKMTVTYLLDNLSTFNKALIPTGEKRYTICNTTQMNEDPSPGSRCGGKWDKIVSVNITLSSSGASSSSSIDKIEQSITDSVGWHL
jgi:prepilin-type N-terminal cleavage/methylation domain-containing protein